MLGLEKMRAAEQSGKRYPSKADCNSVIDAYLSAHDLLLEARSAQPSSQQGGPGSFWYSQHVLGHSLLWWSRQSDWPTKRYLHWCALCQRRLQPGDGPDRLTDGHTEPKALELLMYPISKQDRRRLGAAKHIEFPGLEQKFGALSSFELDGGVAHAAQGSAYYLCPDHEHR